MAGCFARAKGAGNTHYTLKNVRLKAGSAEGHRSWSARETRASFVEFRETDLRQPCPLPSHADPSPCLETGGVSAQGSGTDLSSSRPQQKARKKRVTRLVA